MCTFFGLRKFREKLVQKRSDPRQNLIDWNLGGNYFTESLENKYDFYVIPFLVICINYSTEVHQIKSDQITPIALCFTPPPSFVEVSCE